MTLYSYKIAVEQSCLMVVPGGSPLYSIICPFYIANEGKFHEERLVKNVVPVAQYF